MAAVSPATHSIPDDPIVPLSKEEIWARADAVIDTVALRLVAEEVRAVAP
jgi:hypothetical protein